MPVTDRSAPTELLSVTTPAAAVDGDAPEAAPMVAAPAEIVAVLTPLARSTAARMSPTVASVEVVAVSPR
ncbi:hypothetical protein ABIF52_007241 [Bradyrhizobium japonicum]